MHQNGDRGAREGGSAELLGEHDRAERVHLGAAVFGGIANAEEAELAHVPQHLARHVTLLLPLQAMRLDLGLDEAADLSTQQLVLFAEVGRGEGDGFGAVHGSFSSCAAAPSPEDGAVNAHDDPRIHLAS